MMVIANGHELKDDEPEIPQFDQNDTAGLPPELLEMDLEHQKRKSDELKKNPNATFAVDQFLENPVNGGSTFGDPALERLWNTI